jgi:hypothetical protein
VIEYYTKRFGEDLPTAFIHLIREIGEIALAMEKSNTAHAKLKITEAAALLQYIATRYDLDLDGNIQSLYAHKLDILNKKERNP